MTLHRRSFLKATASYPALLCLAPHAPSVLLRTALASAEQSSDRSTVLVVVQLTGGNDGLNTVVPVSDAHYGRNRHTLRLTAREVLKIDDDLGFHPALTGMSRLFNEGRLSVVQGVGHEGNNRDHDAAMRDWYTARPGDATCDTGWLGRAIDAIDDSQRIRNPGVFVGPIAKPLAMTAQRSVVPHIRSLNQWPLASAELPGESGEAPSAEEPPLLQHLRRTAVAAHWSRRQIDQALHSVGDRRQYPNAPLGGQLKIISDLVRADFGIRIFFTELGGGGIGGFDNHANQRDNHAALLRQLSEAVTAFVDDLDDAGLADRVALMTFSEFGRTLQENGRRGTDHGNAAPIFLAGGRLQGGLHGAHPDLTDLEGDSPKPHTDFRQVYATVLDQWLGFDSRPILHDHFSKLNLFRMGGWS